MGDTAEKKGYSFGTFQGVYTPSILTILGVVMYLRFGWVLGNVGLASTLLIVTLATAITFLTGLSISAMASNMKVGGGGAYYIISRSLGLEAGAAIGLPLFFARVFGVAFYIAGFSEAVMAVGNPFPMFEPALAAKLVSVATLVVLTALAYFSADLALKAQYIIFAAIIASLISFAMGSAPVSQEIPAGTLVPPRESFWFVFAVFFPAVTGIEAGLGMSGDLKDPAKSLPLGTMAAIGTGYLIYMILPIIMSLRISNSDLLIINSNIINDISRWRSLILAGVFAASLSSALGSLLGAPRTLQALANDRILPRSIGRGYGKDNDPRVATAISFAVALAAILLGDLNLIAPILSMFFLTSYGLLNLSAGLEGLIAAPSWRPKFKVASWIPLVGAAGCFAAMLMINAGATFVAALVSGFVFYLIKRRSLNAHWGDMRYGILMLLVRFAIHRLNRLNPNERTWRPNILALSGSPRSRWHLVEMAHALTRHSSSLTISSILPVEDWSSEKVKGMEKSISDYLQKRKVNAMVKVFPAANMLTGAKALVRAYGFGPLSPNTILLGDTEKEASYSDFAELINLVHRTRRNLVMLRENIENDAENSTHINSTIDVWWGGEQNNIGLILTLAYQLQKSPVWKDSRLCLKTIANSEEEREAALKRLETFIEDQRIPAEAVVMIKDDAPIFDTIRNSSADAELVFMGMRAPDEGESIENYAGYYAQLIESTQNMPPIAMVLASEAIEFRQVIGIAEMR